MIEAKVIADSISPDGVRLTTVEATSNRFVLAEANTHRVFNRNSASSRAIPLAKQIKRIMEDLAVPSVFPKEQRGMQGGEPLDERTEKDARKVWEMAAEDAVDAARALGGLGVHKSIANRLLEPFMWHTMVITATAWENFFLQRCHPDAQPEIRLMAEAIRDAMEDSKPILLEEGQWHLPYVDDETRAEVLERSGFIGTVDEPEDYPWLGLAKISAARCAQLSYLTQPVIDPETQEIVDPGGKVDIEKDLFRYEKLAVRERGTVAEHSPIHWSPLEHVGTPWAANRQSGLLYFSDAQGYTQQVSLDHLPKVGNLLGWRSLRTEQEAIQGKVTFR